MVQLSLAAANRDPDRFERPDVFDPARHPRGVLSIGYGSHGCLGARLAHEQTQIALLVLLRRTRALQIDESAGGSRLCRRRRVLSEVGCADRRGLYGLRSGRISLDVLRLAGELDTFPTFGPAVARRVDLPRPYDAAARPGARESCAASDSMRHADDLAIPRRKTHSAYKRRRASGLELIVGCLTLCLLSLGELLTQVCSLLGSSAVSSRLGFSHRLGSPFLLDALGARLLALELLGRNVIGHHPDASGRGCRSVGVSVAAQTPRK